QGISNLSLLDCIKSLRGMQKQFVKNQYGRKVVQDKDGNSIEGSTLQILHRAMIDPRLQPYAAPLIKATAESHKTIGGVRYLLSYLAQGRLPYRCLNKNEPQFVGYDLYFATNKDRVAFDGAVKELGIMPYVKGALV